MQRPMRPTQFSALAVFLAASAWLCAPPRAAESAAPYLFDAMKRPSYREAWLALLRGKTKLPAWLGQIAGRGDFVGTPGTSAAIGGVSFELYHACKAHDCAGNEIEVMFAPGGAQVWAALIDHNEPIRYLARPNAAQAKALASAFSQQ